METDCEQQPAPIQLIREVSYPAEINRYELILTKTRRFFIIDLTKTETEPSKNE